MECHLTMFFQNDKHLRLDKDSRPLSEILEDFGDFPDRIVIVFEDGSSIDYVVEA